MNIFFFIVFILFVALVVRLGIVQIVQGEEFAEVVSRTDTDYARLPAPRGKMFDRYQRVVVDNIRVPAITYTVDKTTKASDKIATAKKLSKYIQYDQKFLESELKPIDLKDYWLAANPKKAIKLLNKDELKLKGNETYRIQIDRVPEEETNKIAANYEQLELAYLYKRFSSGYQYEPQVVKSKNVTGEELASNLTDEELSTVSERLEELPGVDVITDWGREYPYEQLQNLFGGLTSPEQGILQEREEFYLSRDYSRNERVGKSYLEYEYEDYLNPRKAKVKYTSDKSGNVVSTEVVDEGRRGYDLKLSFDIELQKEVDKIVEEELRNARSLGANYLMDRAFVVIMEPYNGDVLAMSGKLVNEKGEINDYSYGAFTTQYEIGSTIKGATVLAGFQNEIPHSQTYYDAPIKFKGTPWKKSYMQMNNTGVLKALQKSSNVYMFYVAMDIAGIRYVKDGPFSATKEDFQKLRNYFAQFGLGVPTGIDLPNESPGLVVEEPDSVGKLLDIVIGQYDTYTPLQMAQYVSAIANGGYRIQPRVVTSIHSPVEENTLGPVAIEQFPKVLNKVDNSQADIELVKRGFKMVTSAGGTAATHFELDVSGKTGTSETHYYGPKRSAWGRKTNNLSFVGYFPSDKPEISFSIVVPWAGTEGYPVNKKIGNRITKAYAELQKKYASSTNGNETNEEN
ncbi:peptidoglycan D,D-transpeptidase FtsI family protein [Metabacillus malikii]|nr:penicillin-binding protein 2 [Metabacillus malikii]